MTFEYKNTQNFMETSEDAMEHRYYSFIISI